MSPIERAVAAAERELGVVEAVDASPSVLRRMQAERIVRAVLQAAEPSDRMLSDGAFQIFRGERITVDDIDSAKRVWNAMRRTALAE